MMKNKLKKININIVIVAIIVLISTASLGLIVKKTIENTRSLSNQSDNKKENNDNKEEDKSKDSVELKEESSNNESKQEENKNTNDINEESKKENNSSTNNSNNESSSTTATEEDVIKYFQEQDTSFTLNTVKEKAKDIFVTTVDFLFYNKEIKGYTFNKLTTSAKITIIKVSLSIDNKIDKYFKGYKESISTTYKDIKAKIVVLYLDTITSICNTVGEDACQKVKEEFKTVKETLNLTWEIIKDFAKGSWNKLAIWYDMFKE